MRQGYAWDEAGLHKKLISRGAESYLCPACLGEHLSLSEGELRGMIERFRRQGCALFSPWNPAEKAD